MVTELDELMSVFQFQGVNSSRAAFFLERARRMGWAYFVEQLYSSQVTVLQFIKGSSYLFKESTRTNESVYTINRRNNSILR